MSQMLAKKVSSDGDSRDGDRGDSDSGDSSRIIATFSSFFYS